MIQRVFYSSQFHTYAHGLGYSLDHGVTDVIAEFAITMATLFPKEIMIRPFVKKLGGDSCLNISTEWLCKEFTESEPDIDYVKLRVEAIVFTVIYQSCIFANARGRRSVNACDAIMVTKICSQIIELMR